MGEQTRTAREEVLAARAALSSEVDELGSAARSAVDIPAKVRRNPAQTAGLAAGAAFFALGIVGAAVGMRAGGGVAAAGGLVAGAVFGALAGAILGGAVWEPRVAAAVGVTVGLLTWTILTAIGARGLDFGARFRELWPRQTYETALETRAWLEQEWANRRERLTKRS